MPLKKIWLSKKSLKYNTKLIMSCTYCSKKKKSKIGVISVFVYKHLKFKYLQNMSNHEHFHGILKLKIHKDFVIYI